MFASALLHGGVKAEPLILKSRLLTSWLNKTRSSKCSYSVAVFMLQAAAKSNSLILRRPICLGKHNFRILALGYGTVRIVTAKLAA